VFSGRVVVVVDVVDDVLPFGEVVVLPVGDEVVLVELIIEVDVVSFRVVDVDVVLLLYVGEGWLGSSKLQPEKMRVESARIRA